ncbi:MAG: virulence protein [Clostridia bacterium]|nr:virulence protein [Clostridia bacterium]
MTKTIDFNISKQDRKKLVNAIAEWMGEDPVYCGAPTFAYTIGAVTVDKDGYVTIPTIEEEEIVVENLLEFLTYKGFVAAIIYDEPDDAAPAEEEQAELDSTQTTVRLPADGFTETAKENLLHIISAKSELIKKALGVADLPVEFTESEIVFPWFTQTVDADDFAAYRHFISALTAMAGNLKRSTAKEKDAENEKYAFRCFLLRLGFIGAEYKGERKILLRNLSGSSAFRTPKDAEDRGE